MDQPNAIFIVLDTLRKDVVPMYGGNAYTPNLNEFAKEAVVFPNPVAPSPWTVPSHTSFFIGKYAMEHGVHEDKITFTYNINEKLIDLPDKFIWEILIDKGYNALSFSANGFISPDSGYNRSWNYIKSYYEYYKIQDELNIKEAKTYGNNLPEIFINLIKKGEFKKLLDYYKTYNNLKKILKINKYPFLKGSDLIVKDVINSSINEPFFIFLNFMEVHEPLIKYEMNHDISSHQYLDLIGEKRISENKINKIKNNYLVALKNLDEQIGILIKFLKNKKLYDNTLVIVTSDHGQAIKEKRRFPFYGHGNFLYNELIEVPLIIKFPKNKKVQIKKGYQSLVKIPNLIKNIIDGNIEDVITTDSAFSENYGPQYDLNQLAKLGLIPKSIDLEKIKNTILYPRKAVYKNDYKLVINGLNGEIDEFLYKGKEIKPKDNKEVLDDLLDELEIFKGTEKFVVRKN
jgi:arylsulfatase A-like enzyme